MFGFLKRKKRDFSEQVEKFNRGVEEMRVSASVDENMNIMKMLFTDVDVLLYKSIEDANHNKYLIAYTDGLVNSAIINENILRPLMLLKDFQQGGDLINRLVTEVVQINESEPTDRYQKIISAVSYGDTILFADGCSEAAILSTKSIPMRAVSQPDSEKTLSGSKEGFTESIVTNLALIRKRARTNDLKVRKMTLGRRTQTGVMVCYLSEIVHKGALAELMKRLQKIDIDGVLDSNYVSELICDFRYSLFRTVGSTERPDVVVGKILEGRIAILVDGCPDVLTVPFLFVENFQSSEDYTLNYYYTSFSRFLRMLGFFLTIAVPGLYVAIVAFHHEMMPNPLLISITMERQSVPLPAAVEAFVMLLVFEILRETGVRMPNNVGQALSIVGALVIGQAAVQAKLVAAPMIIVVGLTGITNLIVPKIRSPIIYIRLFVLLLSSMFGFFGFTISLSLMLIHILKLTSFGVPMLLADGRMGLNRFNDSAIRVPWWKMTERPEILTRNRRRMGKETGNGPT